MKLHAAGRGGGCCMAEAGGGGSSGNSDTPNPVGGVGADLASPNSDL